MIPKDPLRARTSLFINYVRSVHLPLRVHINHVELVDSSFFYDNPAIKIGPRIDRNSRERERGEFPSSPYSNRYRLARVMRAIYHSPRLDKPRREEKQTFPPRWIHVAVGQDKCAYILKEPRTCYRDGRKRRSVTGDPERKREAIRMDGMNEQR